MCGQVKRPRGGRDQRRLTNGLSSNLLLLPLRLLLPSPTRLSLYLYDGSGESSSLFPVCQALSRWLMLSRCSCPRRLSRALTGVSSRSSTPRPARSHGQTNNAKVSTAVGNRRAACSSTTSSRLHRSVSQHDLLLEGGAVAFVELTSLAVIVLRVDGSLYPPKDVLALRKLLAAIRASSFDRLKKDCLVYYLIRDTKHDDRAASFAQARLIPAQFVSLADGYWNMDNGNHEVSTNTCHLSYKTYPTSFAPDGGGAQDGRAHLCFPSPHALFARSSQLAVSLLSSISVKPDFTSKILATLAKMPVQAESARLVLHFIRFARPPIDSPEDVHVKLDALAQTSIREAWMYMRSFDEGEFRAGLIGRVFEYCLTRELKSTSPLPSPAPPVPSAWPTLILRRLLRVRL